MPRRNSDAYSVGVFAPKDDEKAPAPTEESATRTGTMGAFAVSPTHTGGDKTDQDGEAR